MRELDVLRLISVAEAMAIIDSVEASPRTSEMPLLEAAGLVLAESICADGDAPPFDKGVMDGFAVRSADVLSAPVELRVIGEVAAGKSPPGALKAGEAMAIMTGAPVPAGADCVVPIEDIQREQDVIRIGKAVPRGKAIALRGSDIGAGAAVLEKGVRLGPAQIAVAASVGAARVRVHPAPQVAVLVTGDELVQVDQTPGPAQIRNSNGPMLVSLLKRMGCHVRDLGMANDDPAAIRRAIEEGLLADVLFVSGGMSMGEYDYVPRILRELGVELHITKLKIKPGKPFVFGAVKRSEVGGQRSGTSAQSSAFSVQRSAFVFGLPGNPVSAFVCTVRLASRLIARLRGESPEPTWVEATLAEAIGANGPREFYQPAILENRSIIHPLTWKGSADIYTLARANALLVRAENEPALPADARVRALEV